MTPNLNTIFVLLTVSRNYGADTCHDLFCLFQVSLIYIFVLLTVSRNYGADTCHDLFCLFQVSLTNISLPARPEIDSAKPLLVFVLNKINVQSSFYVTTSYVYVHLKCVRACACVRARVYVCV